MFNSQLPTSNFQLPKADLKVRLCGRSSTSKAESSAVEADLQVRLRLPGFRALRPQHQLFERGARVLAAGEQLRDLGGNRQLDAVTRRKGERGVGRPHTLSHHLHAREDVLQGAAARQLDADMAVPAERAGAGQHEIAEP